MLAAFVLAKERYIEDVPVEQDTQIDRLIVNTFVQPHARANVCTPLFFLTRASGKTLDS